jgi:hypothetical protein
MTSIPALLAELENRGIILFLANGEIRYRSPKDALTPADREALRARRGDILAYLTARGAAKSLRTARGVSGPLTASVAQEMWWRFAGGAREGEPVALNIGMAGTFRADAAAVTAAIRQVIARHDALRVTFRVDGEVLHPTLNAADEFEIEQEDLRGLGAAAAAETAAKRAREFGGRINFIEGPWLTRAKVFALPDGEAMAAISSAHMIADAGTRNIVLDELRDMLEHGAPRAAPSVPYNDYSLAERVLLAGPQGDALIDYWRRWYEAQPVMLAPSDKAPLLWGNGVRIIRNFSIPGRVLGRIRALADELKVTPFLVCLTIFSITLARWSGMDRFPVRVLGDKRTTGELSNTVGLMFCADAVQVHAPAGLDFESILRGILAEYDGALGLRIPTLHFWAPHCVRPHIEARDFPNRIPAVFNYYSVGTARERAEKQPAPDASQAWPPQIHELPAQTWPRRSSPLFLHLMDYGSEMAASLHFYENVVSKPDQDSFTAMLFQTFDDVVPA